MINSMGIIDINQATAKGPLSAFLKAFSIDRLHRIHVHGF
jgi:hypothetical protein